MRKVKYFALRAYNKETTKYESKEIGEAIFHQFGVEYEEHDSGPGNYSTAIIELPNGEILNHPVNLIRFTEPLKGGV